MILPFLLNPITENTGNHFDKWIYQVPHKYEPEMVNKESQIGVSEVEFDLRRCALKLIEFLLHIVIHFNSNLLKTSSTLSTDSSTCMMNCVVTTKCHGEQHTDNGKIFYGLSTFLVNIRKIQSISVDSLLAFSLCH